MPNIRKINVTENSTKGTKDMTNVSAKKRGRKPGQKNVTHTVYVYSYTDKNTGEVMTIRTSVPNAEIFGPHGERATIVRHEKENVS